MRIKCFRRQFSGMAASALAISAARAAGDEKKPTKSASTKGPIESTFERDYEPPTFKPSWKNPQLNRQRVQDFVIFAHSDLKMVEKMLGKEPRLLNSYMDWGAGDWESALGGASHMGRHDIVELLLDRGARIDIFCAAMMGQLEAVRSFLTLQPKLVDAKGPHGFTLHFHAQVGGKRSEKVLEYLQSVKKLELKPIPFMKKSAGKKA